LWVRCEISMLCNKRVATDIQISVLQMVGGLASSLASVIHKQINPLRNYVIRGRYGWSNGST
jgi:hypothetical protein